MLLGTAAQGRVCTALAAGASGRLGEQQRATPGQPLHPAVPATAMLGRLLHASRSRVRQPGGLEPLAVLLREPLGLASDTMAKAMGGQHLAGTMTRGAPSAAAAMQAVRSKITAAATRKGAAKSLADTSAAKDAALSLVMKEINDKFGQGSLMQLGEVNLKVDTISSGALTLDVALGGGFPKGRIVEIYGAEASGKTTLALHAMAEVQKTGGKVALVDAEHAFDPLYAKRLGLDVHSLLLCQPDYGEMGLDVCDTLIRSSAVDLIVVDSVAALTPRAEVEGEVGMQQIGLQARMMSQVLRKLVSNASKANCTVIFINQLRSKVGVIFGNPEVTPGGNSLKYYASVRVDVRKKAVIKTPKSDQDTGIRVRAKVVKNKVAPPYRLAEFDIMFNSGISAGGCLLDVGEKIKTITRRGSHYYYGDTKLGNGRENAIAFLQANPDVYSTIEAATREAVLAGVDTTDWYSSPNSGGSTGSLDEEADEGEEEEDDLGGLGGDELGQLLTQGSVLSSPSGEEAAEPQQGGR